MPARPDAVAALPAAPGVYRFRDDSGRVLYVGRAGELRRRVSSYWGDLRDRRHLRRMMLRVARIEALVCDSAHEAAWAERNLLERSLPRWNRIVGGLEVPVSIGLDASPEAPRLVLQRQLWRCLSAGSVVRGAGLGLASSAPPGPVGGAVEVGSRCADEGVEQAPQLGHGQCDELAVSGCSAPFFAVARVADR
jgi:hypothetical protein